MNKPSLLKAIFFLCVLCAAQAIAAAVTFAASVDFFKTVVQFNLINGTKPNSPLVKSLKNGNFYGTTEEGTLKFNSGTVFEITPAGVLTTLYSFCSPPNCADGSHPV